MAICENRAQRSIQNTGAGRTDPAIYAEDGDARWRFQVGSYRNFLRWRRSQTNKRPRSRRDAGGLPVKRRPSKEEGAASAPRTRYMSTRAEIPRRLRSAI